MSSPKSFYQKYCTPSIRPAEESQPLLNTESARSRRYSLLDQPHIQPLCDYRRQILALYPKHTDVPHFDPLDGGINARALFLFEAPQRTVQSGFISRENPDSTAANCRALFEEAGIARQDTLLWNVVPWLVEGNIMERDVRQTSSLLVSLVELLPKLEVIVLMGSQSWLARPYLEKITQVPIKQTWMPSAMSFNAHKKKPEVQKAFKEVATLFR